VQVPEDPAEGLELLVGERARAHAAPEIPGIARRVGRDLREERAQRGGELRERRVLLRREVVLLELDALDRPADPLGSLGRATNPGVRSGSGGTTYGPAASTR
jgi:hypothetical protein